MYPLIYKGNLSFMNADVVVRFFKHVIHLRFMPGRHVLRSEEEGRGGGGGGSDYYF